MRARQSDVYYATRGWVNQVCNISKLHACNLQITDQSIIGKRHSIRPRISVSTQGVELLSGPPQCAIGATRHPRVKS